MSDSEDDYMSDKFLDSLSNPKDDVRPGLIYNRTAKRQHELHKQHEELKTKKPKTRAEIENELREKGLNTAISSENKGFKLLEKMGFKPGEGLGKQKTGLKEPIKIEVKQGTSGVGRENHIKEKITLKKNLKEKHFTEVFNEFKNTNKEKTLRRFLEKDFVKAQKVCEDLDLRNDVEDPIEEFFWTRATIRKRRAIDEEDDEEVEEFNAIFNSYMEEDNLCSVIDYLRQKYFYCMYCALVANDAEDLETNCPGPYRSDHDDG